MDDIKSIMKSPKEYAPVTLNMNWELAEEIARITGTTPPMWLRQIRDHLFEVKRAMIDFNELKETTIIRNKQAFFCFLIKKHTKVNKSLTS